MTNRDTTMTTAEAVTAALIAHGIDQVYGLPGTHNDDLFDAFYRARDRLRFIHARHEQAGAFMALGAALVTGTPQVFSVVPGPGLLNAGAAILTAQAMNAPIVGLVGQIPQREIDRGHGYLHEIRDQLGLARHIAKSAARIASPAEAPRAGRRGVRRGAARPARPRHPRMRDGHLGPERRRHPARPTADRRNPAHRRRRRRQGRRDPRPGQAADRRGRRRRAGRQRRGDRARRTARGAGHRLSPRPGRGLGAPPAQRQPADRAPAVARRRRGAGDRDTAPDPADPMGHRRQAPHRAHRHRPGGAGAAQPARRRAGRRRRGLCRRHCSRPSPRTTSRARPRTSAPTAPGWRSGCPASSRRPRTCARCATRCPRTESSSTR